VVQSSASLDYSKTSEITKDSHLYRAGFTGIALQASEEYGYHVFDRCYGELWQTFAKQHQVHRLASLVAPFLTIRSISMALAGTDVAQHQDFSLAAEHYRRTLIQIVNSDVMQNAKAKEWEYKGDRSVWERVPPFQYSAPPLGRVLRQQGWNLAILAGWSVVAVLLAIRGATRLEVV